MLLLKNGTLVGSHESYAGDILIEGEKIAKIFRRENAEEERTYLASLPEKPQEEDLSGKLVFPGFIDAHTHFDLHVAGTVTCEPLMVTSSPLKAISTSSLAAMSETRSSLPLLVMVNTLSAGAACND